MLLFKKELFHFFFDARCINGLMYLCDKLIYIESIYLFIIHFKIMTILSLDKVYELEGTYNYQNILSKFLYRYFKLIYWKFFLFSGFLQL